MIELRDLRKSYKTGDFVQKALDGVSLTFRDNEFVAVLGPSGSGKTTLLNVLGGLDRADEGDIVINGTSTKNYRSGDWDTYRNHRIGFIFQSYNLIPHQSVAANVELALTLAGIGRAERKQRALEALERVGLAEHANKKPNQLSGGQMQRVAIARALVNDPEIVLADEPTGALDTETGVQVMNLLQEIANDRLVIMVTHNPELAERYATRIVRLSDGRVVSDTNPPREDELFVEVEGAKTSKAAPGRRARMGFLTALGLSFNNLMTKKGRTFMTAFAGSIGIIGIAAILSLSNGVNNYIADTEEQALTSYPLTITKSAFDFTSMLGGSMGAEDDDAPVPAGNVAGNSAGDAAREGEAAEGSSSQGGGMASWFARGSSDSSARTAKKLAPDAAIPEVPVMTDMFAQVKNNDLATFKTFLESKESGVDQHVNSIQYTYGIVPHIYMADTSKGVRQLNPSTMGTALTGGVDTSAFGISGTGTEVFNEMMDDREMLEEYMDVVAGRWPEAYDECALVLSSSGRLTDFTLYSIGYYDPEVMDKMTQDTLNGKEAVVPETAQDFSVDKAMNMEFKVVPTSSFYEYNGQQGIWTDISNDDAVMKERIKDGLTLRVVGVLQASPDSNTLVMQQGIAYTPELTEFLMKEAAGSSIVKQQQGKRDVDVFTGKTFEELQDEQGKNFDLSSMFSVDEDAMVKAFGMDESAFDFSSLAQGMDFSSLDLGSMDVGSLGMDPSAMNLDFSGMAGAFDEGSMRSLMAGAPQFSLQDAGLDQQGVQLDAQQQKQLEQAANTLSADFLSWALKNKKLLPDSMPDASSVPQQMPATEAPTDQEALAAMLDQAQKQLLKALANSDDAKAAADAVDAAFDQAQGAVDAALDQAQEAVPSADATRAAAQDLKQALAQAQQGLEQAVANLPEDNPASAVAQQALDSAQAALDQALAGGGESQLDAALAAARDAVQQAAGQMDSIRKTADDGLEAAQQAFDQARQDVEKAAAEQEAAEKAAAEAAAKAAAEQAAQVANSLQSANYGALFQEYMQTPSAQAIMQPVGQQLGSQAEGLVNSTMQSYMANQFIPYFSSGMQSIMTQAGQALALQLAQAMQTQIAAATQSLGSTLSNTINGQLTSQMAELQKTMQEGFSFDADAFANAINFNMNQDDLTSLLTNFLNADELTYDGNMKKLGYAEKDSPETISIYPKDFVAKQAVLDIIDGYNTRAKDSGNEEAAIQYSDIAGVLMNSVTRIIDSITMVLIAFVSISLVVSSIMIGIITYISVLERRKEIGILRAMGASKGNIANVFNAETFIEGLVAGILAILVVLIASVPVNAWVLETRNVPNIMSLPLVAALVLIAISVVLTFIAGLIPSQSASRRDPVEALRSE